MLLIFSHYLIKHEIYTCSSFSNKNIFNNICFNEFKFTMTCNYNFFNDIIILFAVIKLFLNKIPYFKILIFNDKNTNLLKKIFIRANFNNILKFYSFKNLLFDFILLNDQKMIFFNTNKNIYFLSFDILIFNLFNNFYTFIMLFPKLHFSFNLNKKNNRTNNLFLSRIWNLPLKNGI